MKKLFYLTFILFSLTLVVSCSDSDDDGDDTEKFDDWNDPKSPNFKPGGYNPIMGTWQIKNSQSRDIFTEDFKYGYTFIKDDGEWSNPNYTNTYKINDKMFVTHSGSSELGGREFSYRIEKENGQDVLYILSTKYYRVTE